LWRLCYAVDLTVPPPRLVFEIRQVDFQHGELNGAREQLRLQIERGESDEAKRRNVLGKLRAAVVPRRGKVACSEKDDARSKALFLLRAAGDDADVVENEKNRRSNSLKRLGEELEQDVDGNLRGKWPKLVATEADACGRGAERLRTESDAIQRILDGYRRQFGFEIDDADVDDGAGDGQKQAATLAKDSPATTTKATSDPRGKSSPSSPSEKTKRRRQEEADAAAPEGEHPAAEVAEAASSTDGAAAVPAST